MKKPKIKWVGSPNYGYPRGTEGRGGHQVIAIVNHIMQGTLAGTDAWFNNPAAKASAHFGIGRDGTIHQYVKLGNAAWANGAVRSPSWPLLKKGVNPNLYTVSIEHEGYSGDKLTPEQYQATLALHKWLIEELDLEVNRDTIIGHYRIDSEWKAGCPGPGFPWERLFKDLQELPGTPILGQAEATPEQLKAFWKKHNPEAPVDLVDLYYSIAPIYGVRPDLAVCQMFKETGFLKYGGLVKDWQNNYCGLGATGRPARGNEDLRGADPDLVSFEEGVHGAIFKTPDAGVEAHVQHLFAYAADKNKPFPKDRKLVDPRFRLVRRGSAPHIEDLNGKWAVPGKGYGESIVKILDKALEVEMQPVGTFTDVPDDHFAARSVGRLTRAGIIAGFPDGTFRGTRAVDRYELAVILDRALTLAGFDLDEVAGTGKEGTD